MSELKRLLKVIEDLEQVETMLLKAEMKLYILQTGYQDVLGSIFNQWRIEKALEKIKEAREFIKRLNEELTDVYNEVHTLL